jgi:hypothetical protein
MGILSDKLTSITFGVSGNPPSIQRCSIDNLGLVTGPGLDAGNGLVTSGDFKSSSKVWNAVWNDIADFQLLNDELVYGKCYYDTKDGARICNQRCQMSVIGIASDTFGFGVGSGANPNREVPIGVAGWVLAFVDKEYECGTPLTNDEFGNLTAMTRAEKLEYPERIVALYKRKEMDSLWGPVERKIAVNGRHWIKIK